MGLGDVSLACASALVDALAHRGVRHACLSPGSRSTPLALALDREDRIRIHMHLDERSAAFFALGIAKATGAPAALACTSGTAAAEYLPAVVEASQSRTPIVVLTADRPPRLRGTGANQTIDQTDLYGRYARAYLEPPVPANAADVGAWHDTGIRAVAAAVGTPAGPVHVNCPFDEPLVPEGVPVATPPLPADETEPEDRGIEEDAARESLEGFLETYAGRRGVITLGSLPPPRTLSLLSLGTLLGWPVLAEPLSGWRLDAGGAGRALAAGQLLIGDPGWLERHHPEVVLQVGAAPTTRTTQTFVAGSSLVALDREHLDPDPEQRPSGDPRRPGAVRGGRLGQARRGPGRPCRVGGSRHGSRRTCSRAPRSIACSTHRSNRSRAAWRATWRPSSPTALSCASDHRAPCATWTRSWRRAGRRAYGPRLICSASSVTVERAGSTGSSRRRSAWRSRRPARPTR